MKRGLLGLSLLVFLTQVVSAQFFSGYGRFSIGDFFSSIDPQTIILTLLFLIFFALIFYTLSRFFKGPYGQPNKGIAGVIAFAVSSLIIYGLYRTGFDISGLFYDLGLSSGLLYPIFTILFLIAAGLLIWKLKFSGFLMILGLFMILLTALTDIFYDKGLPFVIGLVLLVVGLLFKRRGRRAMSGVGGGALKAGRGIGRGALKAGRGIRKGFRAARAYREPGHRLLRYQKKREIDEQRKVARRGLADQKAAYRETRGQGRTRRIAPVERGVNRGEELAERGRQREEARSRRAEKLAERGRQREEARSRRAEKVAYKEKAKLERGQQAQQQIQQINREVTRLEQTIPNASVLERGKIEDQIRGLSKRARRLR